MKPTSVSLFFFLFEMSTSKSSWSIHLDYIVGISKQLFVDATVF